jgi:preprotein translocase subunit SecE
VLQLIVSHYSQCMKFDLRSLYEKSVQFLKEVYYELRKTSWLSRDETLSSTVVVVIIIFIVAIFISIVDFILVQLLKFIM